jgi:hypothetical protein
MTETKRLAWQIADMVNGGRTNDEIVSYLCAVNGITNRSWVEQQVRNVRTNPDVNPRIPRIKLKKVKRKKGKIVE